MDMTQPPGVGDRLIIRRVARFGSRGISPSREHLSAMFYSREPKSGPQLAPPARLGPTRPAEGDKSELSEKLIVDIFFAKIGSHAIAEMRGRLNARQTQREEEK
jgi:hypothetical protein